MPLTVITNTTDHQSGILDSTRSIVTPLLSSGSSLLRLVGLANTEPVTTSRIRDWLAEAFGCRKLVIAATPYGRVYAIDLGDGGKVVWDRLAVSLTGAADSTGTNYKRVEWKRVAIFDKLHNGKTVVMAVAQIITGNVSADLYSPFVMLIVLRRMSINRSHFTSMRYRVRLSLGLKRRFSQEVLSLRSLLYMGHQIRPWHWCRPMAQ